MKKWKKKFIEFSLKRKVLKFGNFKLRSGRNSPYFFNSKYFCTGSDLLKLGECYAHAIIQSRIHPDILLGLAYKGIPIVVATVIALKIQYNINLAYSFNRKEIKTYGDGGIIVGKSIKKNNSIIIIDDVLTSGLTIQEFINLFNIKKNNVISGIFLIFDRQEYGTTEQQSSIQEIETAYSLCKIFSIINICDLIQYLIKYNKYQKELKNILEYYKIYGSKEINY
ncbi:Orotate phosphoribosyltransferase [Buchnera aphidicola (Phyllaphis fagi)]|uniref:orotate phosphoribosyltransferase n=1 Tax=Buchnera aphidicola TaxID=9 RepID=UPI003463DE64